MIFLMSASSVVSWESLAEPGLCSVGAPGNVLPPRKVPAPFIPLLGSLCLNKQLQCGEEMDPSRGFAQGKPWTCPCPLGVPAPAGSLSGIISVLSSALGVFPRSWAGPTPCWGLWGYFCLGFSLSLLHRALCSTPRSSAADPGSVVPSV